jgi:hypothetical protein
VTFEKDKTFRLTKHQQNNIKCWQNLRLIHATVPKQSMSSQTPFGSVMEFARY